MMMALATELLKANTDAVARPPISVIVPHRVVRLMSANNLTTNSMPQKT
ncbi:MAG: hypothetical protein CM1200mP2_10620 [Planctomycetaceae bacterium]|nr:MAG: hypothetical protein CM1200mP2_10620 [Planctomycetaceae bacterium]